MIEEVPLRLLHHHLDEGVVVRVEDLVVRGGAVGFVQVHIEREGEGAALGGLQALA